MSFFASDRCICVRLLLVKLLQQVGNRVRNSDPGHAEGKPEGRARGSRCGSLTVFFLLLAEKRQDNGRVYYVNHNTRTTQWEDPRTQG